MKARSKNKIVKDSANMTFSRIIIFAIGFVKIFILARILNPAGFGVLNAVNLIINYAKFSQLGFRAAALREVPLESGRGNKDTVLNLKNVAFSVSLLFSLIVSLLLIIIALKYQNDGNMKLAYLTSGIILFLITVYSLYETESMINNNFLFVSRIRIVDTIARAVMVLLATFAFGVKGALASMIAAGIFIIFYCRSKIKLNFSISFRKDMILRLGKVGIPIFLGGIVWTFFLTGDSLLIVSHIDVIGKAQYGLYSFAIALLTIFYTIASDTSVIIYRHSLSVYSKSNDATSLFPLISKPSLFVGYICPFLIGQIVILADPAISYLFPKYTGAILIVKIMSFAFFFMMLSIYHVVLLVTLNMQNLQLYVRSTFLFLLTASVLFLIKSGHGIVYISFAKLVLWFTHCLFIIIFTNIYITKNWRQNLKYLIELFIPLCFVLLIVFITSVMKLNFFVASFLFTIVYIPFLVMANKKLGLLSAIKDFAGTYDLQETPEQT